MIVEISGGIVLLVAFVISYLFYSSKNGGKSIYRASYAWKVDFLAMLSGAYCIWVSYFFYKLDWAMAILAPLFIIGTIQFMMHAAKWRVRAKK